MRRCTKGNKYAVDRKTHQAAKGLKAKHDKEKKEEADKEGRRGGQRQEKKKKKKLRTKINLEVKKDTTILTKSSSHPHALYTRTDCKH